jgi:uncharacterized protein (TIGR02118 family)
MVKVSVLYPNNPGAKFDMDYYLSKHIPMVRLKVGPALKAVSVERGVAGGTPGSAPTYLTTAALSFDSTEAFLAAFGPHAAEIMADVPNYTNVQPLVQVGEVKL